MKIHYVCDRVWDAKDVSEELLGDDGPPPPPPVADEGENQEHLDALSSDLNEYHDGPDEASAAVEEDGVKDLETEGDPEAGDPEEEANEDDDEEDPADDKMDDDDELEEMERELAAQG